MHRKKFWGLYVLKKDGQKKKIYNLYERLAAIDAGPEENKVRLATHQPASHQDCLFTGLHTEGCRGVAAPAATTGRFCVARSVQPAVVLQGCPEREDKFQISRCNPDLPASPKFPYLPQLQLVALKHVLALQILSTKRRIWGCGSTVHPPGSRSSRTSLMPPFSRKRQADTPSISTSNPFASKLIF